MRERIQERCFWLTEEEAMGLLDMVMLSPEDLTSEQRAAILKLSDFCRQFLRNEDQSNAAVNHNGDSSLFVA